ncbi:CGNR zinc finger domain-containing protein [Nocardia sp. NPDC057030]|uniref:CGNR zinc finger domain-containing protein n=1 Tax=unclassified Nocardia TaxID=2637762 RepID=UPI00363256E8
MSPIADSQFRLDNESLAFRFTATLTDRYGRTRERLDTPESLSRWWDLNDLDLGTADLGEVDLAKARRLRETIHRLGTCVAEQSTLLPSDVDALNSFSRFGGADLVLDNGRARWELLDGLANRAALSVVAQDAISTFGGANADRVRTCGRDECRGLFIDTSRAGKRRWCSMNTCGNREKKAQMRQAGTKASS